MTHIRTHRDYQLAPLRQFVQGVYRSRRQHCLIPDTVASGPVVQARINHGNWIADCPDPDCAGAELVDPDDLRFWCCSCSMANLDGQWLPVQMTAQRAQLEAELRKRPRRQIQNWAPGESLADLRRENAENGVT